MFLFFISVYIVQMLRIFGYYSIGVMSFPHFEIRRI